MRPYEVMIILDPGLDDDAVRASVDRSTDLIRANGGTVGRVDRWGRRRLAYEIRHQREGYYVLVEASAPPAAMAELDRVLLLADEVLRHKVIRLPERVVARPRRTAGGTGGGAGMDTSAGIAADEAAVAT
jgi:small subunit ribosomal protein S6